MKNRYIAVFAVGDVGAGVFLHVVLRGRIRYYFDVAALIPQVPDVGLLANLLGLAVVLPAIVLATISGVKRLGLDEA